MNLPAPQGQPPENGAPSDPAAPEAVVVIDDDYAMRLSCAKILSKMGLRVEVFEDGARGLEAVVALKPSLVVVDHGGDHRVRHHRYGGGGDEVRRL